MSDVSKLILMPSPLCLRSRKANIFLSNKHIFLLSNKKTFSFLFFFPLDTCLLSILWDTVLANEISWIPECFVTPITQILNKYLHPIFITIKRKSCLHRVHKFYSTMEIVFRKIFRTIISTNVMNSETSEFGGHFAEFCNRSLFYEEKINKPQEIRSETMAN